MDDAKNDSVRIIESQLERLFEQLEDSSQKEMIDLWKKLEAVDMVYYHYYQEGEPGYQRYKDRYRANQKFSDRIQKVFREDIFEIDGKSILEMWQLLLEEEASAGQDVFSKMKLGLLKKQKNSIQKKLRTFLLPKVQLEEEEIEAYLKLLNEQDQRKKQLIDAQGQLPEDIRSYFIKHGENAFMMHDRCLVLDYCVNRLKDFGFLEEEMNFWREVMMDAVTNGSEAVWSEIQDFVLKIEMGEKI